jgi:hypothetical protein
MASEIDELISKEALANVEKLSLALDKVVVSLDKVVQQSSALDTALGKLSTTTNTTKSTQDGLSKSEKEAEQITKQLRDSEDDIVKAKIRYSNAVKDQNTALRAQVTLENEEAGTLEKLRAQNSLLTKEREKLNLSTKTGRQRLKEINGELDKNNSFIKKNNDALGKQKINIGNYTSAISGMSGPIGSVIRGFQSLYTVLVANPIGIVIGAIVGVFTLLIKAFKGTEEGGDKITRIFAQIKATVDVLVDRIKNVATTISKIFTGEAKLKDLKGAFKGIGEEIKNEVKQSGLLADMMDKLEDKEIDLITVSAERTAKIAKLREELADTNKTDKERLALAVESKRLMEEEAKAQQEIILTTIANELGTTDLAKVQERINEVRKTGNQISLDEIGLSISTNVNRKKVNELIAQYIGKEEQASSEGRRLTSTIASLNKGVEKQIELFDKYGTSSQEEIDAMKEAKKTNEDYTKTVSFGVDDINKKKEEERKKQEEISKAIGGTLISMRELTDAEKKQNEARIQQIEEEIALEAEKKKQIIQIASEAASGATEIWSNFAQAKYDKQLTALEDEKSLQLEAAGDNEQQKAKIEADYEKKKRAIQRKAAIAEKIAALANVGISVAKGIVEATAMAPGTLGASLALIPVIIATGAIQAAVIAAKPIAYAKGTKYSKEGPAIVGEKGAELRIEPSGQVSLTGDSPELTYLKRGTQIIPSDETKRIISIAAMSKKDTLEKTIERGNKDIVRAIREQEQFVPSLSTGRSITTRKGNQYKEYFERHLS